MSTLITIVQFFAALAILVTLHELGHFLAARAFGIRVEKFYLFFDAFGVKLFKFKKGETEYGVGWLPLGGYVKIAGMVDESLDQEQLASEPQSWEFRSKPAWQRLIVMIGGVVVNVLLGIVILSTLTFVKGDTYIPNQYINKNGGIYASPNARAIGLKTGDQILKINNKDVDNLIAEFGNPDFLMSDNKSVELIRGGRDTVIELPNNMENLVKPNSELPFISPRFGFSLKRILSGSSADKSGLIVGDKITAIDTVSIKSFFEFKEVIAQYSGKETRIYYNRDGKENSTMALVNEDGTLGFQPEILGFKGVEKTISYGLFESIGMGCIKSYSLIVANLKGLTKVVTGKVNAKNALAGPVGIAQMYGPVWDWVNFWEITALISLALALMNILPIPALDGGHVVFLLFEMIAGRPVGEKVLYIGQIIGMVILLSLFVFIFWVDISRALGF